MYVDWMKYIAGSQTHRMTTLQEDNPTGQEPHRQRRLSLGDDLKKKKKIDNKNYNMTI